MSIRKLDDGRYEAGYQASRSRWKTHPQENLKKAEAVALNTQSSMPVRKNGEASEQTAEL